MVLLYFAPWSSIQPMSALVGMQGVCGIGCLAFLWLTRLNIERAGNLPAMHNVSLFAHDPASVGSFRHCTQPPDVSCPQVLLYAPQQDRFAAADAVRAAATSAEKAWVAHGAAHAFQFVAPDKPSDFKTDEIHQAVAWLRSVA
eukprot:m.951502 g.951502  ORF g.951502 m.951502 type:complete len:143 (-) comp23867_c0_seq9:2494-2922(-)